MNERDFDERWESAWAQYGKPAALTATAAKVIARGFWIDSHGAGPPPAARWWFAINNRLLLEEVAPGTPGAYPFVLWTDRSNPLPDDCTALIDAVMETHDLAAQHTLTINGAATREALRILVEAIVLKQFVSRQAAERAAARERR
jgi:hypothetical protein